MKRPAGAATPDDAAGPAAKKAATTTPVPSYYDAKSRHHILFKTGLTGKGQTKTLSYSNEKERLAQISEAKRLVKAALNS